MRLASPWTPRLAALGDSPADRLTRALADDIGDGRLEPGARLPAQRDIAFALDIGLGSVTKAFAALERRGLVRSEAGRGCFVAAPASARSEIIDLAFNAPPALLGDKMLAGALARIAKGFDPTLLSHYPPLGGHEAHRRAMARWLGALGGPEAPERTLLCDGAQQALSLALSTLRRPGEIVVTEAPTYPGFIALARMIGLQLVSVRMDAEGVTPQGLDAAFARAGARPVVYLTPTAHNPTGATMGLARRRALVDLCRARDALIVEDDVYAHTLSAERPALATLAPERVFYVSSLSKTVSPGLRVGALVAPPLWREAALSTQRATCQMAGALSCLLMTSWMEDGSAEALRREIAAEHAARQALAVALLGEAVRAPSIPCPHLWAPMSAARAQAVATLAAASGVHVTPPEATRVDESGETGIRLCLGSVDRASLETALTTLRRCMTLSPPAHDAMRAAL
jgi:DNA-binding transcriptional MocR family regulator